MRTALGLFAIATTALAQTAVTPAPQVAVAAGQIGSILSFSGTVGGGNPFQPVIGHPYSAEQVTERTQTLADGTHITQTVQTTKLYRDSASRTRTEHIFTPPAGVVMGSGPSFVQISDPVAGYRYMLNSRDQTARRSAFAPTMQRSNVVAAAKPVLPAEPDPVLFQVPGDYAIVDEPTPVVR